MMRWKEQVAGAQAGGSHSFGVAGAGRLEQFEGLGDVAGTLELGPPVCTTEPSRADEIVAWHSSGADKLRSHMASHCSLSQLW